MKEHRLSRRTFVGQLPLAVGALSLAARTSPAAERGVLNVGFIGLKRDEATLAAHFYHKSLPKNLARCEVILIDPMLATGGSAVAAIDFLQEQGAKSIRLVSLVAAPEGIARVRKSHPKLPIFTASIDRQLNHLGYILPGLGDAGDRLFGT